MSESREFDDLLQELDGPMPLPTDFAESLQQDLEAAVAQQLARRAGGVAETIHIENRPQDLYERRRRRIVAAVLATAGVVVAVVAVSFALRGDDHDRRVVTNDPTPAVPNPTTEPSPVTEPSLTPTAAPEATPEPTVDTNIDATWDVALSVEDERCDVTGAPSLPAGSRVMATVRNDSAVEARWFVWRIPPERSYEEFVAAFDEINDVGPVGKEPPAPPGWVLQLISTDDIGPGEEVSAPFVLTLPGTAIATCTPRDLSHFTPSEPFVVE